MVRLVRFSAVNLALAYVALSLVVLTLFATPLGLAWRDTVHGARAELLQADARRLEDLFQLGGARGLATTIDERVGRRLEGEKIILFADAGFTRIAGNLSSWPKGIPDAPGSYDLTIDDGGTPVRAMLVRADLPDGYHLLVGRDVARFRRLETLFWYGLAGTAAIVLLIAVVGGLAVRRAFLTELNDINRTAAAIVEGDLSHRVPTKEGTTEFDMLARTLNRMLDQIEQLVHGVRNASNAIAHDLRTPVSELRSRLEDLSTTRSLDDGARVEVDAAIGDVDRVLGLFNALLRLAEIESGARRSGFAPFDVVHVANDVLELYRPLAEERRITLDLRAPERAEVVGDPLLVAQALGNLVDNAVKYAKGPGAVRVDVDDTSADVVMVSVGDDGPGIADEEKRRVTERFYRGDASRGTPGTGLGLSLVAAVATLHGGRILIEDNHPGVRITWTIARTSGH